MDTTKLEALKQVIMNMRKLAGKKRKEKKGEGKGCAIVIEKSEK